MRKLLLVTTVMFAAVVALPTTAAEYVVAQKGKAFSVKTMKVKVGDAVSFKNEDPYFHNVFSLSDAKTFDLGSYPAGQARKVVFDKSGKLEVECAIHPEMILSLEITP